MNQNPTRSPRSQRMLVLTVVTAFVALFGAVVVADGAARLLLGGFAVVLFYDVFREFRKPGDIERKQALDDQPAGPWLLGVLAFVIVNAVAWSVIRDRTDDGPVQFLLYALAFGTSYGIGQLVHTLVSRLPRYRVAAGNR